MAMVSAQRSTLNPDAPLFIPVAYRKVEDFSPEWWDLVKGSTWFREFWLSERPEGTFDGSSGDNVVEMLPEDLDVGGYEDLADLDAEVEELVMLVEGDGEGVVGSNETTAAEIERKPADGLKLDVKALLKEVGSPKSPREINPRLSSVGPAKYQMKPPYCVSPKHAHRRIYQPR